MNFVFKIPFLVYFDILIISILKIIYVTICFGGCLCLQGTVHNRQKQVAFRVQSIKREDGLEHKVEIVKLNQNILDCNKLNKDVLGIKRCDEIGYGQESAHL